jgi:hypothetical protein
MNIMLPRVISIPYFINPHPSNNTNTATFEIVEAVTLIILESLNRSLRKLVFIT